MGRRSKNYVQAREQVDRDREYEPIEAIALLKGLPKAKFDESVEVHVRLGLNVRHAEEQLRGTITLPHGVGKELRVIVFAEGEAARAATDAGADRVGSSDLAEQIEAGFTDFDVAVATPDMMPTVAKLGRILGPQGKMPNPKIGTVTDDVTKAVNEVKAGKLEYRTDRSAIVHMVIGRASFGEQQLLGNYSVLIDEIVRAKPAAAKGRYIESISMATTMGPGIKVSS